MEAPDNLLSVFVTEPVELPNGIQGYRIITQTNMTDVDEYQRHENIVIRSCSEFLRLRDRLSEEFPEIPAAHNVVGFSPESIKMQCRALDNFLKSLVSEPALHNSVHLRKFLVAEAVADAEPYGKCVPRMAARLTTDLEEIPIFVNKLKEKKMAGNVVLLDGGNRQLRIDTVKLISDSSVGSAAEVTYFYSISGSEEHMLNNLKKGLRRATGLRVELSRKFYEGEVTEFQEIYTDESNKAVSSISIVLRTTQEVKKLRLGKRYFSALRDKKVAVGDSIVIHSASGAVDNKGPATPGGKIINTLKIFQNMSLHDLDKAIDTKRKDGGIYDLLISQNQNVSAVNIDEVVESLIHKGLAKRLYGILYIYEAHNLSSECFSLISNALESSCLSVYLTTLRGMCHFRGLEICIPNRIPSVLLPRLTVIQAPKDGDDLKMATFFWNSNERQRLVTPIVDMLRRKKMNGCVVLLAGPLQTEKSGLAFELSKELGNEDLFFPIIDTDEYPVDELKEILQNTVRQAVGLKMRKTRKVYQGEVVELSSKATGSSSAINWENVHDVVIGLRTNTEEQHVELDDEQLSKAIIKKKVAIGDVVIIDVYNKVVTKIGRSHSFSEEKDNENNVYVALPKGEVLKMEKIQDITIDDLYKTKKRGHSICKQVRKEMSSKKLDINKAVKNLVEDKAVELQPGVLFVDGVDSLHEEIISFISKMMKESENLFPVLIFSTDKNISEFSLTGLSTNLLDHMVIVHTQACEPPKISVKELEPRTLCSVPALEKEVKSIDAFQTVNASFGAGSVASIVLAAANSDTTPHTFGLLIAAFTCCCASLLHYICGVFDLQSSIKSAKDSKSTKEIWMDRSKVKKFRWQVLWGFVAGTVGVGFVIASLVAYIMKKFHSPASILVSFLVVIGCTYVWFVIKIWKEVTAVWRCEEQRRL